jgi:D-arabinose 1-dehydrogenase-like Zn-dependent alcohol dehydrogenase
MRNTRACSAARATSPLTSATIPRRDPTHHDVQIEILFPGICHSDLHSVRNEWSEFMPTVYPIVPGHEIVGRVTKLGCGKYNITADVEVIPLQKVNEAYERLLKSDVKYRFSIDMASLKSE